MKITSWRNCLRKHFGRFLRPARPRTLAKSACVALGLATAWGGEAKADITFQVSITPAHDLLDAFVYYGNNSTGGTMVSLGPLEGERTHNFLHTLFPDDQIPSRIFDEVYQPDSGRFRLGYGVGGVYEDEDGYGVTFSYPNSGAIDSEITWSEFTQVLPGYFLPVTEEEVAAQYLSNNGHSENPWYATLFFHTYWESTLQFGSATRDIVLTDRLYTTTYGEEARLTSFGYTRFAGTAIVSIVPEPASAVSIAVMSAGLLVLTSRRTMASP